MVADLSAFFIHADTAAASVKADNERQTFAAVGSQFAIQTDRHSLAFSALYGGNGGSKVNYTVRKSLVSGHSKIEPACLFGSVDVESAICRNRLAVVFDNESPHLLFLLTDIGDVSGEDLFALRLPAAFDHKRVGVEPPVA